MQKTLSVACVLFVFVFVEGSLLAESGIGPLMDERFCADANGDGQIDISDPVRTLNSLFGGGAGPYCIVEGLNIGAQLAELESTNSLLTQSNADLSAHMTELETNNASLIASLDAVNNTNAQLTESNVGLSARITELETNNASLIANLDAVNNTNALLTQTNTDLTHSNAELVLEGCTDPEATNYDLLANVDDGSCFVPSGFIFSAVNTQGYSEYTHAPSGLTFVLLPGGEFQMGSPESEAKRGTNEPLHTVTLSPFLIAKYEVTQAEYEAVMTGHASLSATPSFNFGYSPVDLERPVEQVSWHDLQDPDGFLARTGLSLPSEAQWEYASRGGQAGQFAGTTVLEDMGWYFGNASGSHQPVGAKQGNQVGLHDMHGNVFEWCEDVYAPDFYETLEAVGLDPLSDTGSGDQVCRGGSFLDAASNCRSANRFSANPGVRVGIIGFRPAMPLP